MLCINIHVHVYFLRRNRCYSNTVLGDDDKIIIMKPISSILVVVCSCIMFVYIITVHVLLYMCCASIHISLEGNDVTQL